MNKIMKSLFKIIIKYLKEKIHIINKIIQILINQENKWNIQILINKENKWKDKFLKINHMKDIMIYHKMQIIQEIPIKLNFKWIESLKD